MYAIKFSKIKSKIKHFQIKLLSKSNSQKKGRFTGPPSSKCWVREARHVLQRQATHGYAAARRLPPTLRLLTRRSRPPLFCGGGGGGALCSQDLYVTTSGIDTAGGSSSTKRVSVTAALVLTPRSSALLPLSRDTGAGLPSLIELPRSLWTNDFFRERPCGDCVCACADCCCSSSVTRGAGVPSRNVDEPRPNEVSP